MPSVNIVARGPSSVKLRFRPGLVNGVTEALAELAEQTASDALATSADRTQTGLDRAAAAGSAIAAGTQAGIATDQAGIATDQAEVATDAAGVATASKNTAVAALNDALAIYGSVEAVENAASVSVQAKEDAEDAAEAAALSAATLTFASESEAEAGEEDGKGMSPLATAAAVQANIFPTRAELLTRNLPAVQTRVRTSGHTVAGVGGAEFVETSGTPSAAGFTTPDGRKWEIAELEITPDHFGCIGDDGEFDNAVPLQAWLDAINLSRPGRIPAKIYWTKSPISRTTGKGVIIGDSKYNSVIMYNGADTTVDIFTLGAAANWTLLQFRVDSATTMTAGAAYRLTGLSRSVIRDTVAGGQDGNNKIFDGWFFDGFDQISFQGFDGQGLGTGVKIKGGSSGPRANLFMGGGFKLLSFNVNIHIGGGAGGITIDEGDAINAVSHNVVINNALVSVSNREIFFGDRFFADGAGGDNVYINDTLAANSWLQFDGAWVASAVGAGYRIVAWTGGQITIVGGNTFNNGSDGIRIESNNPRVNVTGHYTRNNTGYGINDTTSGNNVFVSSCTHSSNVTGKTNGLFQMLDKSGASTSIGGIFGAEPLRAVGVANIVNRVQVSGAATGAEPTIQFEGSDTNVGGALQPKGTGSGRLRDGSGAQRLTWNNSGVAFNGTAPIAKPTVTGAKGGNAALASLLTALANYGLITDSSSA